MVLVRVFVVHITCTLLYVVHMTMDKSGPKTSASMQLSGFHLLVVIFTIKVALLMLFKSQVRIHFEENNITFCKPLN